MFDEGSRYERFMGRWSEGLAPLLVGFADVRDDHLVLDVGSGTGSLARSVVDSVPSARVVGMEPARAFARHARAHTLSPRVQYVVGALPNIPHRGATFNRVLALLVLNFVADLEAALREMIRVTRPGGVIAAAVWDYGGGMDMLRVFWDEAVSADSAAGSRDERHMPLCRGGELGALWRAHGLTAVEEPMLSVDAPFESLDDFWLPFLGGQGPAGMYVKGLPPAAREALRQNLRQRVLPDRADGGFVLTLRAWAVKGVVET
jgi:SAM-dependent methyltransferase